MDPLTIVTWLWAPVHGLPTYGPQHVNALQSMLADKCSMPHRLVCVTDQPRGIKCETIPLWNDLSTTGMCWRRIKMFAPEMREVLGPRIVSLDLDCVIVADPAPLWERDEPFVGWRTGGPSVPMKLPVTYNGSMLLMDTGAFPEVWETFDPDRSPARVKQAGFIGSDQGWWSLVLGPDHPTWTSARGVMSWRYNIKPRACRCLPQHARIVFFHGPDKPWDAHVKSADWVRRNYPI